MIHASHKKYTVGLTGGIGSGKTTVTNMFAEKGIDVIDADLVARDVVKPKSIGLRRVVEAFGENILKKSGELDRAKLRHLVFADENSKNTLNKILHPLIREEMLNQLANAKSQYCILSAPLLVENKLESLVDCVVVVDISEDAQLARTLERDKSSESTIKSIINTQVSRQQRLKAADEVIDNTKDLGHTQSQVDNLHRKFVKAFAN